MKAKRVVSLLIALTMVLALAPMTVSFAEGETAEAAASADLASSYVAAGAFTPDGLIDISQWATDNGVSAVTSGSDPNPSYNTELKRYEASVAKTETAKHYRLPLPSARRSLLQTANGYTLETYFKFNSFSTTAVNGIIGAAQGHGFDFEVSTNGDLEVYINEGDTGSKWVRNSSNVLPGKGSEGDWAKGDFKPQINTYYHLTVTVTPTTIVVYKDGEVFETIQAANKLVFPTGNNMRDWYGLVLGGDYGTTAENKTDSPMDGNMVFANIYDKALTADEVKTAYDDIAARKALTRVDALNTMLTDTLAKKLEADPTDISLEALISKGWKLMNKVGLTDTEIDAYLAEANAYEKKTFPLVYDTSKMPLADSTTKKIDIAQYGMTAKGIWGSSGIRESSEQTKNFEMLALSKGSKSANPGAYPSPIDLLTLDFTADTAHENPVLNGKGYIYESEFTLCLNGIKSNELKFKGKKTDGTEAVFASIMFNQINNVENQAVEAKVYALDAAGQQIGTARDFKATIKSDKGVAGDLMYVKVKLDFLNHMFSAWSVPRMVEGGSYSSVQAGETNVLAENVPFYDNSVNELTSVVNQVKSVHKDGFAYGGGMYLRNIFVDEYTPVKLYNVSGTTDEHVTAVTLKQNGEVKHTGTFNRETSPQTVSFGTVEAGDYDVAVTYEEGYTASATASATLSVTDADVTDLDVTSKLITYAVSGTVDEHVEKVILNQGQEAKYTWVKADGAGTENVITFPAVAPGTYSVVVTYASGYQAAPEVTAEVTVTDQDQTGLNFLSQPIPANTYTVSGITDENVLTIVLKKDGEIKYNNPTIDRTAAPQTFVFAGVEAGAYTIEATYAENYEKALDAADSVTVESQNVENIKVASRRALRTVVGTIDQYVQTVTLNQNGEVKYAGVLDYTANTVTFTDVADGDYDIAVTYEQNYTAKENEAASTVKVAGTDIAASELKITSQAPSDGITLRLAVLSDLQYGRSGDYRGKFRKAMATLKERIGGSWDNLDVLMIPGDISHNSSVSEFTEFYNDLQAALPYGSHTKVMFLRGNHDAKEPTTADPNRLENFVNVLSRYDPDLKSPNNTYEVNGYQFVMVSQDTQKSNDEASSNSYIQTHNYLHSKDTIDWFAKAMDAAGNKSGDKPIFVGMHPNTYDPELSSGKSDAISGTVFGSYSIPGFKNQSAAKSDYWATSELYEALRNHHNAVTFSGHSHWTVANEQSIHQRDFTSLNTGAVNNMEIENAWDESFQPKRFGSNENESNGYYITVNTNQDVNIERMDLFRMANQIEQGAAPTATLGEDWSFRPADLNPEDPATIKYASGRDKTGPRFLDNAWVRVLDDTTLTSRSAKVVWSNKLAEDTDSDINHYQVDFIKEGETDPSKSYTVSSYYWQRNGRPEENNWTAGNLEPATNYTVRITAYDQFYNPSSNTISATFRTKPLVYGFDVSTVTQENLNSAANKELYGLTAPPNSESGLYSIKKAMPSTIDVEGLQFTTWGKTEMDFFNLNFAKDKTNNPNGVKLTGDKYVYELEFMPMVRDLTSQISIDFLGKTSEASEEAPFATMILEPKSMASEGRKGDYYFVNSSGAKVGGTGTVILQNKDSGNPQQLLYVKVEVDVKNGSYSAWASVRKTGTGAYGEPLPGTLVTNQKMNTEKITELSSVTFHTTKHDSTNGLWLKNISIADFSQYSVSGTVDSHVQSVKLVGKNNLEEIVGQINGTEISFGNVPADVYDIVAEYEEGYTAKGDERRTLAVYGNIDTVSITSQPLGDFSAALTDKETTLNSLAARTQTTVSVAVQNPKAEAKRVLLFYAMYDKNETLRDVKSTVVDITAGDVSKTIELPVTPLTTEALPQADLSSIKLFVWSEDLIPYDLGTWSAQTQN